MSYVNATRGNKRATDKFGALHPYDVTVNMAERNGQHGALHRSEVMAHMTALYLLEVTVTRHSWHVSNTSNQSKRCSLDYRIRVAENSRQLGSRLP